jgi:hypothetical protein
MFSLLNAQKWPNSSLKKYYIFREVFHEKLAKRGFPGHFLPFYKRGKIEKPIKNGHFGLFFNKNGCF